MSMNLVAEADAKAPVPGLPTACAECPFNDSTLCDDCAHAPTRYAARATHAHIPAEGIKHDAGKPRYDLIPPEALDGLARLYAMGAEKYEDRNWEKGMKWSRIFSAMMRHAWAWFRGETYDKQDKQHHLLSVIWCAMALYAYEHRGTGTDDRPKIVDWYKDFWRQPNA